MEPIGIQDIIERQRDFAEQVRKRIESAARIEHAKPERVIEDHEGRLAALRAELDAAISAREAALRRYDDDIARKKEEVDALGRELDEMKQALSTGQERPAEKNDVAQAGRKGSPEIRDAAKAKRSSPRPGGKK